jgi:hypothetical protein
VRHWDGEGKMWERGAAMSRIRFVAALVRVGPVEVVGVIDSFSVAAAVAVPGSYRAQSNESVW